MAEYTITFLNSTKDGSQAAKKQFHQVKDKKAKKGHWRDLHAGQWMEPSLLLTWARGYACVFQRILNDQFGYQSMLSSCTMNPDLEKKLKLMKLDLTFAY